MIWKKISTFLCYQDHYDNRQEKNYISSSEKTSSKMILKPNKFKNLIFDIKWT